MRILIILSLSLLIACSPEKSDSGSKTDSLNGYNRGLEVGYKNGFNEGYNKIKPKEKQIIYVPKSKIVIAENDLDKLVAEVKFKTRTNEVVSETFEAYAILDTNSSEAVKEYAQSREHVVNYSHEKGNYNIFKYSKRYNVEGNRHLIMMAQIVGFESVPVILVDAIIKNDTIIVNGVLSKYLNSGLTWLEISGITKIDSLNYMVYGKNSGGEGGDVYESRWFYKWKNPYDLSMIYSTSFSYYFEDEEKKFSDSLDTSDNIYYVKIMQRKVSRKRLQEGTEYTYRKSYGNWKIEKQDTVDLMELIKK